MSRENVEVARQAVEAFNAGGIEAAAEYFDPEVEFHEPPEQPGATVARGRDAVIALFGQFEATWEEHRSEPDEIRRVDEERVLLLTIEHFRGRDQIEITAPSGTIFAIRDGRIVRWQTFWERTHALEACGLSE